MRKIVKQRLWTQVIAIVLAMALNLGVLDGIINGLLRELHKGGLISSRVQLNSIAPAYADPGEGSFTPGIFDPNHNETSTLKFKFDYDHDTEIELFKGGNKIKTLEESIFFEGRYDDEEDETPENITNQYTWNGKDGAEPMDDGNYTIVLTPLDKWSKYPLEAEVRVRNIPHTPVIKNISINQTNGTVSLSGTSQPNHVIHLYDNGSYYFSVTADANGNWWAYNRHFTKEKRHTVNAKAENKKRNWPTLSALSNSIVFLTYQIKAGDTLSDAASYYLGRGARWTEIKNSTGIKDEKRIYAGNWLLVMNPLREGPYNKPGKIEPNDKNNKNGEGQKSFADPVNSVTGNYYTLQRDLFIPGRGLPFEFTRTYNSQSDYRGHLGFRWDFNLSRSLIFYNDGSIGHKRGDGGIDLYTSDNQGNFVSPAGVYDALKARGDGTYHITQKDRREYNFDSAGYLVGIVDRNGNTISLQYNEDGQLAQVNDTVGRQIRFIYDEEQRITAIIDPQNRKGSYHYDANGDLVAVTDVNGGTTRYEYDENHFMIKSTDPKGYVIVENTYDAEGRVKTQKDAKGNTSYFNYDPAAKITGFVDNRGVGTEIGYDDDYRPVTEIRSVNNTREATAYDAAGNKASVTDFNGNTTYYGYDAKGNLTGVTDPAGKTTIFNYDGSSNLTSIVDAKGNITNYQYDSRGNVTAVTDAAGKTVKYEYNSFGQIAKIIDRQRFETNLKYDDQGNLLQITDPKGHKTQFTYDVIGRILSVADAKGNTTGFEYDNKGLITKTVSPLNQIVAKSYDPNGNIAEITDPKGNKSIFAYDSMDNLVQVTDPLGNITRMEYDANNNRTKIINPQDGVSEYKYDELNRVREITDPMSHATKLEYDHNGNIVAITDPKGFKTRYDYDKRNQITAITNALNLKTEITYDELGNLIKKKDPKGSVTSYEYDQLSRVIRITSALNQVTSILYDDANKQKTVTGPDGNSFTYAYDPADNLATVTDPLGNRTKLDYDENNNLTGMTDALGQTWKYEYDEINRLVKTVDPLENLTQIEYDLNNNPIKDTDAEKNATQYRYDNLDRLARVIDALGNETEYKYDALGNLLALIDARKNVTAYEYDLEGRLLKVTDPVGKQQSFSYDTNDNLVRKIDGNGISTLYGYDALNRLTSTEYPGETVKYQYDGQGNRTVMEDAYGITAYDYNLLGYLTAVTNPDGKKVQYQYNNAGQRSKITYPDGREVKYLYDKLNRLQEVTDWAGGITRYAYDAIGRRTQTQLPNGARSEYRYDPANNLITLGNTAGSGKLLSKFDYGYDKVGNRTSLTEILGDETDTTSFQYDPLYQLKKVTGQDGRETRYAYDEVGNRTEMVRKEGEIVTRTKYNYNSANELMSLIKDGDEGPTSFRYDNNGNLINMTQPGGRATSYYYDPANRLIEVDLPQDKIVVYGYDGDGNKVLKMASKSPVKEIVNGNEPNRDKKDVLPDIPAKGNNKAKKQQADLIYMLLKNDGGSSGGGNSGGNGGGNSGGNGGGNSGGNSGGDNGGGNSGGNSGNGGNNGNGNGGGNDTGNGNSGNGNHGNGNNGGGNDNGKGNDGDKSNNGNGQDKEKDNNGKGPDKDKQDKDKAKDKDKGKGYKGKGRFENRGKHLGWYKNGKFAQLLENGLNPELLETTNYVNDVAGPVSQVLITFDDQDNYQAAYAYGLERIKVQALDDTRPESQDPLYYLYDGLGSVRQLIRPNGAVRDHYNYDEFGVPGPGAKLSEDGRNVNHNTFGYTGEMWDEEDDLLYLRSRHYAPKLGRFLTRDVFPGYITNPLSMHKYAYVENNPVNFIDPLGFNKKEQSKYGYNDDIYRNYSKNYDDYMRQKADEATKIFVDSEGIRRKGMNVDYEYYENLAALGLWEAIPDQVRREMEGIKPDPVGEFVFIDLPAGGIAGGARSALGRTVTKEAGEAVVKGAGKIDINIKPNVSNEKLKNIVNDLYKGQGGKNTIGNGTTMDAVRNEIRTGLPTNGKFHTQKLNDYLNALQRRLRAGDLNAHDTSVVNSLIDDINKALSGQ